MLRQLNIRLSVELADRLKAKAQASGISLNQLVVQVLAEAAELPVPEELPVDRLARAGSVNRTHTPALGCLTPYGGMSHIEGVEGAAPRDQPNNPVGAPTATQGVGEPTRVTDLSGTKPPSVLKTRDTVPLWCG